MRGRTRFRRFGLLLVLAVSVLAIGASSALAQKPVKTEFPWQSEGDRSDICGFPVHYHGDVKVTEIDYFDPDGALIRMDWHMVEQDTFTANGKTLVSLPFTFEFRVTFDSQGNPTHGYADGVTEKIWLPDGSLFISAGRLDFAAHDWPAFILSPDHGKQGNIARFCAALQ
jgi:hypothetical protein